MRRLNEALTDSWVTIRIVLLSVVGLAGLGWLYYALATMGPKKLETTTYESVSEDDPMLAKDMAVVESHWQNFRRVGESGVVTPAARDELQKAVELQRQLLRAYPRLGVEHAAHLAEMETALASADARGTIARIELLDRDGKTDFDAKHFQDARLKISEALDLQRAINSSNASARYKNYVRESSLMQLLASIEADPLHNEMEAALNSARLAASEERWGDALAAYVTARDMQDRINREYPRTLYADLGLVDKLESEIASLNAAGLAHEIDEQQKQADAALAMGKSAEASKLYAAARLLQLEVNQKFNRSRFVSATRLDELETLRQTAESTPEADRVVELDKQIRDKLVKRQIVAAQMLIDQAATVVDKLFVDFPKSRRLEGDLKLKLAYLKLKSADLRTLQDEVYERLLPLPGVSEQLLLKTETPQSLYLAVMNTNPSRQAGRFQPVDSVNWIEAREFCQRLGWLLGCKVRLPTRDEFRIAVGDACPSGWTIENAKGRSQEVGQGEANQVGFYDLLGNVAEWLNDEKTDAKAFVSGGSYLDTALITSRMPVEERSKSDRARHVGFRFLVEMPQS